jgi:hypothetical protein
MGYTVDGMPQCGNCLRAIEGEYVHAYGEYYHPGQCLLASESRMPDADDLWDNPFSGYEGE